MDVATSPRGTAGIREIKNHLSAYLDRVRAGEEIVITDRGRPIARLTAIDASVDRLSDLIDRGIVTPATTPRSLPVRRVRATGSISELVADQRR